MSAPKDTSAMGKRESALSSQKSMSTKVSENTRKSMSDDMSSPKIKKCDSEVFTYDVKRLLNKRSTSYIHRRISSEIVQILGDQI